MESYGKKKILYHSDFSLAKTGFGRAAKAVLSYLYNTNNYEIVHYCCGVQKSNPELNRTPWKSVGSLPSDREELEKIIADPQRSKMASYGNLYLDEIIKEEKPDIYIGVQDIWGLDFAIKSEWFNKINSIIWTTLDSLPILPDAIEYGKIIKNYWIWSNFATKELNRLGFSQAITMNGPIQNEYFSRFSDEERAGLRKKFNINGDKFIIGFVFRNQLRKSLPNLLEGYALWKKENPNVTNTALLLHTSWKEGWNINKLAKEYSLPNEEILTTYICQVCKNYSIQPFSGEKIKCNFCQKDGMASTTSVNLGVSEEQLNEIYNLMDVYCHPFTSGGQEIPIQEAKLAELITLVTNYSCGEEMCEDTKGTIPLNWYEYREHGTEFKKASTDPNSIKLNINKIYRMKKNEKRELEKISRQWAINKYSATHIGEKIDKILSSLPDIKYDFILERSENKADTKSEELLFDTKRGKIVLILNISNDLDILYTVSIPERIKKMYPHEDLYLILEEKYFGLFTFNKHIDKLIKRKPLYNNQSFLKKLKMKYNIINLIQLDEYSSEDKEYLKFNKTNIEINI